MSSDTVTTVTNDDNRYQAIQAKLTTLSKALDDKATELESLRVRMRANAKKAEDTAQAVEDADLDPMFVELTHAVAVALGSAAVQVRRLTEDATAGAAHTRLVRRTHARLYGKLDEIRSTRRHRTPKPGFFSY